MKKYKYTLIPKQIALQPNLPRNKKNLGKQIDRAFKKNQMVWFHFKPVAINDETMIVTLSLDLKGDDLGNVEFILKDSILMTLSDELKQKLVLAYKKGGINQKTYKTFIK